MVCVFAGGYAGLWAEGNELVLLTGIQPMRAIDEVVTRLKGIIDEDSHSEAQLEERKQSLSAASAFENAEPAIGGNPDSEVPVSISLLMRLHNALPAEAPERGAVRGWIASKARRPHWIAMGVVLQPDGTLAFDAKRYSTAVWRAKQETHAAVALERMEKVASDLKAISSFLNLEHAAGEAPPTVHGEGLAHLPDSKEAIASVNRALTALLADLTSSPQSRIGQGPVDPVLNVPPNARSEV